jgi:hypothetical protein
MFNDFFKGQKLKRYSHRQTRTYEWIPIEGVIHKDIMKSKWMKKHTLRKSKKKRKYTKLFKKD